MLWPLFGGYVAARLPMAEVSSDTGNRCVAAACRSGDGAVIRVLWGCIAGCHRGRVPLPCVKSWASVAGSSNTHKSRTVGDAPEHCSQHCVIMSDCTQERYTERDASSHRQREHTQYKFCWSVGARRCRRNKRRTHLKSGIAPISTCGSPSLHQERENTFKPPQHAFRIQHQP